MNIQSFELKTILPNPFRRVEKYPLVEAKVENLVESIKTTGFWENIPVRINSNGKPEIAFGHHRLAALRKFYPETQAFDWNVRTLTDGQMIQMMARENGEAYRTDANVLRETITATLTALGAGQITPDEMPIDPKTNTRAVRYAPGFGCVPAAERMAPYTVDALAKFLGEVKSNGHARDSFRAAFDALELISEAASQEDEPEDEPEYTRPDEKEMEEFFAQQAEDMLRAFKEKKEKDKREAERAIKSKADFHRLLETAKSLVSMGHRELAKKAHPDTGGTVEKMQEVNAAKEWLLQRIAGQLSVSSSITRTQDRERDAGIIH